MPSYFDQLPSARGGGFYDQLPSIQSQRAGTPQRTVEDIYQGELANAIARADALRNNRQFAVDPATGKYPVDQNGILQLTPAAGFTEEDINKTFEPLNTAFPQFSQRSKGGNPRVVGSSERGYSVFNPDTGQTEEILPGRQGMLSDIDKFRASSADYDRKKILDRLTVLPAGNARIPYLKAKLAEAEATLKEILGGQQAPQPEPQKAPQAAQQQTPRPAPRNQIFIGGQTALEPEEVAQLEAAERGYFGSGMSQGIPPVDSGVPPPDQPAGPFDAFNANFRENFGLPIAREPGSQSTINAPAAQFQPPAPPVSQNFPTNQQGLRQFGTKPSGPSTNRIRIRNIRQLK